MDQLHPGLNLINLKFLLDAARLQSVSLAAKCNFVTQSAVSQGIQKLEKALEEELTSHRKNQFALTREGKIVVEYGQKLFNLLEEMREKVGGDKDRLSGTVDFGCPISLALVWLPVWVKWTKENMPDIALNAHVKDFGNLLKAVRAGEVEFGIGLNDHALGEFDTFPLHRGFFEIFTCGPSLSEGIYVDSLQHPYVQIVLQSYKKAYKKNLKILGETDSWMLVYGLVESGVGCGFFPDFFIEGKEKKKIKSCCDKIPSVPYEIVAFFPKGTRLSSRARAVLEMLAALVRDERS